MKNRPRLTRMLVCLLFAVILIMGEFSAQATSNISATALKESIENTYLEALEWAKKSSFNGLCGTCVSYQLYTLGITDTLGEADVSGKNSFDQFKNESTSSGGYSIKAYPASKYSLKAALNAIYNGSGTNEVYNILVGFEWYNSKSSGKYGHVLLIHGIINGKVYYVDSFGTKQGIAQVRTIDNFCATYGEAVFKKDENGNVVKDNDDFPIVTSGHYTFDGAIHFGGVRHKLDFTHLSWQGVCRGEQVQTPLFRHRLLHPRLRDCQLRP